MLSMRKLQKAPDDLKLQRILQVLDEDQDGVIDVTDALKVRERVRESLAIVLCDEVDCRARRFSQYK